MKLKLLLMTLFMCMLSAGLMAQAGVPGGDPTINRCEVKTYTITVNNSSGQDITNIRVLAKLQNLTGFSYVSGTSSLTAPGFSCSNNPIISGGYTGNCAPAPTGNYLTWNIDASCGALTLSDGDTLTITFDLETDCTAVSGSLNTYIDYDLPGPTPMCNDTGVLNIQVNPGAVTIKKTLNVIPQVLGQDVTWTLTVENTGFGVIENVEITDVLGAGLTYVSSTESGNNSGQTTTWTSNEYAALASMDPGDILTMDITATVIACDNLDNTADVRFGCNPSPANTCFDTSTDGGTARASVQRIVRTPVLGFTPPDITFTYCDDVQNVAFTITNTGDGIAYNVYTIVDFTGFTVSNVSAGAIYNVGQTRFELTDPIAASGGTYDLSFDLTYTGWCGGSFPSGDLLWQKLYEDECAQAFYPPVELSTINAPASASSLAVSKTGGPSQIEIGDPITYTITSSYSGQISCDSPSANTGLITVVDTLPTGFTVTDAGGGVWAPGGGGTGGTITWTYTPPATLNTAITVQSPGTGECETYCNTVFTNSIAASGTDCCGCALNASDSQITAIECAEGVTSSKTSSSPTERCDDTTYTNTYVFSGGSTVNLNDLVFTEEAELQQVFNGNLSILLNGGPVAGVVATDATPGGTYSLDFSGAAATPLAGSTLVISYDLTATANTVAACSGSTFYSWSSLDMGPTGSACLGDGIIHEVTEVTIGSPGMSLDISGLGAIYNTCESKTITITLTQTSDYNPKDVQLVLSGLNYFVVNPGSVVYGGTVANTGTLLPNGSGDYVWTFDDNFAANGANATITLDVQKRCTGGGDLVGTAYFDDRCTDDATVDQLCSVVATETPALLLTGDLLIEKTPETYYANTNTVVWEIYLTNRGTGSAYNVWVDDLLGTGLAYNTSIVDDMTGVTITAGQDHDGNPNAQITTYAITEMAAGERRQITFTADVVDCTNLTNDITTNWGCISTDCQSDVTDSSLVSIPAPNLINTNTITPSGGVDACASPNGFITLRNAGQVTCYNLQVTETLPSNLLYVSGSTRWRLNGGGWNGPNVIYDPSPTTSPLVWTSTEIPGLATATPGDTIEIEFEMSADCPFTGGDITVATQYENPCADVFNTSDSTFTAVFNAPDIEITKTADKTIVGCGDTVTWTIDVTNNSGYTLPIIWLEDTLGMAYTLGTISSTGDATYTGDIGTVNARVVTWEITNLPTGTTATVTVTADTDSSPCSADLDNTVLGWYGCGAADGLSTTKPGVDVPDNNLCLTSSSVSATDTPTREPDLGFLSIALDPVSIDSCDDSTELTVSIENTGPVDARNVDLVITLPAGLSYNTGTSETGLSTDNAAAILALGGVGDPAISGGGTILTWYDIGDKASDIADTIQADGGNDTLVLRFTVQSACYTTANLNFDLYYYDCCDDTQYNTNSTQQLTALFPALTITKTPVNSQVACGAQQSWTITVTNNGTGDAQIVRVEDTPGAWITVDIGSSTAGLTDMGGGVYGWEVNNVIAGGGTAVFTLVGTLNPAGFPNQNSCAAALRQNNVTAVWACGTIGDAIDNDPTTTTNYDCTDSSPVSAPVATLLIPNLVITDIDPTVSCTTDGTFTGTIDVDVQNTGDGPTDGTLFTVQVQDGKGWTGTGTHTGVINAGASVTVSIDVGSWNPTCQPCGGGYDFTGTVDLNGDVCECDETDNGFTDPGNPYDPPIPDLTITDIDFTNISCSSDGVSGNVRVQVQNSGCAAANNFQVALTTDGCLTFSPQTISLGASSSTWVTFNISGSWTNCTTENCDFTATVDGPDDICECDGTNNTRLEGYSNTMPDLAVTNIDYSNVSCSADGVSGFVRVTVQNQGRGSAGNFEVSLATDGCLTFATNQTVVGPLSNSDTATVDFPITGSWADPADCACDFTATVDATNVICECDGTNNTLTTTYNNPLPKFNVNSVTPSSSCTTDGSLTGTVTVNVSNTGCANANNVVVRLASDCGHAFVDQMVNLNSGADQDVIFNFTPVDTACTCIFTASVDPDDAICESGTGNHSLASAAHTPDIPDLLVASDTLSVSCSTDGQVNVSGNLTVQNDGCGSNFTTNIPVRFTLYDNTGCAGNVVGTWTETLSSVNIASGGGTQAFAISVQTVTANMVDNSTGCQASIGVELDYTSSICEYDGTNNSYCADNKAIDIPDVEVSADSLSVACTDDGQVSISGNVTLANNGCGSNLTSNVPMRFTIYDNTGCTGNVLLTWTETFSSVNMVAGGGTQVFAITPQALVSNLVDNSSNCEVSIGIEADYTDVICETDGTDNSYCADNIAVDIPDLETQSDTLTISYTDDGQVQISGDLTLVNNGCGSNLTSNIPVRFTLFDNVSCTGNQMAQWTETLSSVNMTAMGGTQVFTITPFNLTSNLCTNSTACQMSIQVELDYTNVICESDGTDNTYCSDKTVTAPDLTVDAVASTVTCLSDASLTGTTVTVSNNGCGAANNVTVRMVSDCGLTFSDETVSLTAGETTDVFFAFTSGITDCTCTFSATIDPDNTIAECDGTNNSGSNLQSMLIPDLEVQSEALTITCVDDGVIRVSGTVTLINNGCGPNFTSSIPMRMTLFGSTGCSGTQVAQWTQNFTGVNLAPAGGTQTFTIQDFDITANFCTDSTNCMMSIFIEADYNNTICEWDGTDNTFCTDKTSDCLDLEMVEVTPATTCNSDGDFSNTMTVTVRNSGGNAITSDFSIKVDDGTGWTTEMQYSADLGGTLPLAAGASATLTIDWDNKPDVSSCDFPTITATVDSQDEICQCTTDNDTATSTYTMPYPNLKPTDISVTCSEDGFYTVTVTVENDGCGPLSGDFTVKLTDDQGNTKDVSTTVTDLAVGGTTTVTFELMPANCSTTTYTADVDSNTEVCEIDGTDNSMTDTYTDTSPDMVITGVTPKVTVSTPGNVKGIFQVSITNEGSAAMTEDFKVSVDDGEGYTAEKMYQTDLGGQLPVAVDETVTVNVPWNRNFSKESFKCDFNNIVMSLDTDSGVCECVANNNDTVVTYSVPYPDLAVQNIVPVCETDGYQTIRVDVSNEGCDDQTEDFNVTFTDSNGNTQTVPFTSMGGTLPLKPGDSQTLEMTGWPFDCSTGTMTYTVSLPEDGSISDLNNENNTTSTTETIVSPDLEIGNIDWTCDGNGNITFVITVTNPGNGAATSAPVTIYDNDGKSIFTENVTLAAGASTTVTFTTDSYPMGTDLVFRFVVDESEQVCECDGGNNEKQTTINCVTGEPGLKIEKYCAPGRGPGGLIRYEIKVTNSGETELCNIRMDDVIEGPFRYVPGSSALNNQAVSDPSINGTAYTWEIGCLTPGGTATLFFSVVADADTDPGRYCATAVATGVYGQNVEVVSNSSWCCTVITRENGIGCCLDVEEFPMSPFRRPDGPVSFIEPWFHTENAMFTVYSILNLWKGDDLPKGSMPRFMRERLLNYARSTVEEFYFNSQMGLTLPDGSVWLSFGGAYPEQDDKDGNNNNGWRHQNVNRTMGLSQLAFELLALNEAVKVETNAEIKGKLQTILDKKLGFLTGHMDDLPHGWEIAKKAESESDVKRGDGDATLYDRAALYLALTRLAKDGTGNVGDESLKKLRELLSSIDNKSFDRNNPEGEFLFIMTLLNNGDNDQAAAKMKDFEKIFATDLHGQTRTGQTRTVSGSGPNAQQDATAARSNDKLDGLHNYAMAIYLDRRTNGSLYKDLLKEMKDKYYMKDTGIYAQKQPDFTFKLTLHDLAALVLAFDTDDPSLQLQHSTVLYRTFDEVGLFLKKRNLMVGKPLYSILKNYPFSEPLLPVLSFTKAKRSVAPVFSMDAKVHSTRVKPLGENLIPRAFSKILSPGYETDSSRVASVSFGLQYMGALLRKSNERVIQEEGRSFIETGQAYIDSLLNSGAGLLQGGNVLVPFDTIAIKGPKQGEHNLEPLNSGIEFSTETLANYLLAEFFYVIYNGRDAETVKDLISEQEWIIGTFKESGGIPKRFSLFIDSEGNITVGPSAGAASKITVAKLYYVLAKEPGDKFFNKMLKKAKGALTVDDMIFLTAAPEMTKFFKDELKAVADLKDSNVGNNAADILARRLLGGQDDRIEKSLENLKKHWDKEGVLPKSDRVDNIEKGLIYNHEPQGFLLYLLATNTNRDFRFNRTLNLFTYLLENEWGVEWDNPGNESGVGLNNGFITFPSSAYQLFREEPRDIAEPGDLINFRVRVDNTCPEGFGSSRDLSALYLKATFSPPLVYSGTELVEGLDVAGDFQWRYNGFPEGSVLDFTYQAFVPYQFNFSFIDGKIYAGGRQGFQAFGFESASGDDCEDIDEVQRLNILPWEELQGIVYEDANANGIKDVGEPGIANILVKDTRGRLFRSDADGRFSVFAGTEHEGVQIELKSVPSHYLMLSNPTRLVNRHYAGLISFGLIPCKTVTGFVYIDENGNGSYDSGEAKPEGVVLKAKDKEVVTGKDGAFMFRNLPVMWEQFIEIKSVQPFYKGDTSKLKVSK